MPAPESSIANNIADWSVNCSMRGQYGASVKLENQDAGLDKTLRYQPFTVDLNCTGNARLYSADPDCFFGSVQWVNGLIYSVDESEVISKKEVTLAIRSYAARLSRKEVESEDKAGAGNAGAVIESILDEFGTLPAALRDIDAGT